jgi:hypothetical protein
MPILQTASIEDRKRLLELFPVSVLRHSFKSKGTKEEICYAAAADSSPDQIEKFASFVDENLSCCKQHVYVFTRNDGAITFPASIVGGEKILEIAGVRALYVTCTKYQIVLRDPLEETTLDFLWPVRIELNLDYVIVRFVVLEKNPSSYFDRPVYVGGKTIGEKNILSDIQASLTLTPADLNKGIKKLWADGFIDSSRTKFKKTKSTASEIMDEERGIKQNNPELYSILQEAPLFTTLFQVPEDQSTVSEFSTDPSKGIIGFSSYSEKKEDTDIVIEKIISNN